VAYTSQPALNLVAEDCNAIAVDVTGRLDSLTQGRVRGDDPHDRYASLMPFVHGGITQLAATWQHPTS
jgi:hypothetical protein